MATITRTVTVDDLDGSDADHSVTLTVGGKRYQVDLSKANFDEWIAPLVKAASPPRARSTTRRPKAQKRVTAKRTTAVTAYAQLSGKDQGAVRSYLKRPAGRIADEAVKAWKAAGKPKG